MSELTQEELEGLVQAIQQPHKEKNQKIPLRQPGQFKKVGKVSFSPLQGDRPRPLETITEKELGQLSALKVQVDVVYGKTSISLKELLALDTGHLLPLHELCDELVDLYVNGVKIGRGEIVATENQFGVKIVALDS